MRKLLILGLVVVAASCKKDYECECTSTYTNKDTGYSDTNTSVETIVDTKKKYAKAYCASTSSESTTSTYTSDCKLK